MKRLLLFFTVFITTAGYGQLWKEYADSGRIFQKQINNEKAIVFYSKAAGILAVDSAITVSHAAINDSLGKLFIDLQKYKSADTSYMKSKEIKEKLFGVNSLEYALGCFNLGYLYCQFFDRVKEAVLLLENSRKIRESILGRNNLAYALSCHYLGNAYLGIDKRDEAIKYYLEAKEIRGRLLGLDNPEYAKILGNIGNVYSAKSDYANAIIYYTQARESFIKAYGNEAPLVIQTSQIMAGCYYNMSQYLKSLSILQEIQNVILKRYDKKNRLYRYNIGRLGEVYRELGDYKKAEDFFRECAKIDEESHTKESIWYAATCWNMGSLYFKLGQYNAAKVFFIQSKEIREKIESTENMGYAGTCESLAEVYIATREYDKVESLLLKCKEIREKIGGDSFSNNQLGKYYLLTNQFAKAEALLLKGKSVLERTKETQTEYYLTTIKNLANAYLYEDQPVKAKELFTKSRILIEKLYSKQHFNYAVVQKELAETEWKLGNYKTAYLYYDKALNVQNDELEKIFQFTNEIEKNAYLKMVTGFKNSFFSFNMNVNLPAYRGLVYTTAFSNRNLVLSSNQQWLSYVNTVNDTSIKSKYNRWNDQKSQLSFWYTQPKNKRPENLKFFEEEVNKLEREIVNTASIGKEGELKKKITWKSIQKMLNPGEAAIEFLEFQYNDGKGTSDSIYYIGLIVRKNKATPELVKLFEKRQLDSLLVYKKTSPHQHRLNAMYNAQSKADTVKSISLYDVVWKPMEKKLSGIKKIFFASAGLLHKIAFAALSVNESEVLSDKYQLIQLNTTASVGNNLYATISESDRIQLYGGVMYDVDSNSLKQAISSFSGNSFVTRSLPDDLIREGVSDFYYLNGSEKEVNEISKMATENNYSVSVADGLMATEESFKSLSGKQSPVILHIATHGFFFPDPKSGSGDDRIGGAVVFRQSDNPLIRSGLALAGANNAWKGNPVTGVEDGILTGYEVSNMYLPNTKLAVLSACETGLGDIQGSEGVYGLQRAFKMAGVENLVMSLWRVDDIVASEFMQEFYKNLFSKKIISAAFYSAQTTMKNKYRNDPYKWAAWVLIR